MEFEVKYSGNEVWVMRAAGVEMSAYQELDYQLLTGKLKLPATVTCPYFLSDQSVNVRITILTFRHLRIEVPDEEIGKRIQTEVLRYTSPDRAVFAADEEHQALYARIREILEPDGVTPEDVEANRVTLSRRAQQELLALCDQTHHAHRHKIYWQFTKSQIPRQDRAFLATKLLERFALERDPSTRSDVGTVFLNHRDLALRGLADRVIQLVKDSRYGVSRSCLIDLLARTRHSQAAEVIASVLDEKDLAWSALRSLGLLKATQYEPRVRTYLRHPDTEVRLEAKRALKKMGCAVAPSPSPVHLVKARKSLPKNLQEWSANLDFESLDPVLRTLAACIDDGFGAQEIAEVLGVAEETRPEQTKYFRFPMSTGGNPGEVWLAIFMDDINSPDLAIYAEPDVLAKFEAAVVLPD